MFEGAETTKSIITIYNSTLCSNKQQIEMHKHLSVAALACSFIYTFRIGFLWIALSSAL